MILECYKSLGRDSIKPHLSGLRIAQQEMLEKGFTKIDEENRGNKFGSLPETSRLATLMSQGLPSTNQ